MNTAIYHDTAAPTLAVGITLYSIAESEKYVSHNYEPLRNQLQVKLGLVPQFKQDILDAGGTLAEPQLNEDLKPRPWKITRIITQPTGTQTIFMECELNERTVNKLTVQSNEIDGAFVESFDDYVTERMQATADSMIADNESFKRSEESKAAATLTNNLIHAKSVLKRDAGMSENVRNAYHTDKIYMATLEGAALLIAAQAKPRSKPGSKPTNQAERQSHAMRMVARK